MTREPQILILDPELAHEVLVLNFRSYRDSLPSAYIGHAKWDKYARRNPFWASGDDWRRLRSEAQGGLSVNRLRQGFAIWEESGKKLLDYMARQASKHDNQLETRDVSNDIVIRYYRYHSNFYLGTCFVCKGGSLIFPVLYFSVLYIYIILLLYFSAAMFPLHGSCNVRLYLGHRCRHPYTG